MRPTLSILPTLLMLAALASACGDSPSDPVATTGSFVGRVDSSDAFVAIVNDGQEVRAYVCDGTPERAATISEWFKGTQSGSSLDLPSMSGTARLVATIAESGVAGRVERQGLDSLTFRTAPADTPSGFYLYKKLIGSQLYWAGWIVLPNGELRGSMASPSRTSIGVELDLGTGTGRLPDGTSVRPGRMTTTNLRAGMCGPPLCPGFP